MPGLWQSGSYLGGPGNGPEPTLLRRVSNISITLQRPDDPELQLIRPVWPPPARCRPRSNFTNQALAGKRCRRANCPGGPQIGGLNNVASGAMGSTGLRNMAGAIANAANQAPGTVTPYANALSGIGGMALNNPAFSSGLTGLASGKYLSTPAQTRRWPAC